MNLRFGRVLPLLRRVRSSRPVTGGFGEGGSLVHVRCTPGERLDTASIPVVDRQLAKAGVRLAKLLNEVLGKKYAGGGYCQQVDS